MSKRVNTALIIPLVLSVFTLPLLPTAALACDVFEDCGDTPEQAGDGYVHHFDESSRVMHPVPTDSSGEGGGSSGPPEFEYRYRDRECDSVGQCFFTCEDDGEFYPELRVDRRPYGSDEDWEHSVDRICLRPEDGITQEEIETGVLEYVRVEADEPVVNIAPADSDAVVNLPVIVWCDEQESLEFDVENPVPGHLQADPEYAWEFSDGATRQGSGRAYDGTDPRDNDSYYVSNTYDTTGPEAVTLINTWNAIFTYEGIDGTETLQLDPLELREQADFNVIEYSNRLTNR